MKKNWQFRHIVNLEYLLHGDSELSNAELHHRDRNLFLEKGEDLTRQQQPSRSELLLLWISTRIGKEFPGPELRSPGEIFEDTLNFSGKVALGGGMLAGIGAGLTFFTYSGTTPVNVFHFLFFFVFSQLALIAILLMGYLLRRGLPMAKLPSFYTLLFRAIVRRGAGFFHKQWMRSLGAEQQHTIHHTLGIFKARSATYGSLFYWPLFCTAQLLGIGFNLALLAVTLMKVTTSDLAFGWQSTLQISGAAIHQAAKILALPWSWFVSPPYRYPSLEQIEGSRIILKEGIYHLTTANLVAWWPFLVFCLLFYGLIFRICLLLLGRFVEHRRLKAVQFDTPACIGIARRMLTPTLSSQAQPETAKRETSGPEAHHQASAPFPGNHLQPVVVLIPDDIFALCPADSLQNLLGTRGHEITTVYRFMAGYDEDRELIRQLGDRSWQNDEGVFILMESWMPPLVDFLTLLGDLRQILPTNALIFVGLVGRPDTTALTPAASQDFSIWKKKIEAIGDPYVTIFPLLS